MILIIVINTKIMVRFSKIRIFLMTKDILFLTFAFKISEIINEYKNNTSSSHTI